MKNLFTILFCNLLVTFAFSQAPEIEWDKTIGGIGFDRFNNIGQTFDGGYILTGFSNSPISGDKSESSFDDINDIWLIKLNASGEIEWENTIGGSLEEKNGFIEQTNDSGFILGCSSNSGISGEKTTECFGEFDYWVLKLNNIGAIQWQITIGGSGNDELQDIHQTVDGGFILGGYTNSDISGNKTEEGYGLKDFWIVKLDTVGTIEWQESYNGNGDDNLRSVFQTSDGGFVIGGESTSGIYGDKTETNVGGTYDYWLLKLNNLGVVEWQNTIGGSSGETLTKVIQTSDGNYFVGGYSLSPISGEKTEGPIGLTDFWVMKLDNVGELIWQNTIGGSLGDYLISFTETSDQGFLLGGQSNSNASGDKTENNLSAFGGPLYSDCWIVKLDPNGNIIWQNTIGGMLADDIYSLQRTFDNGYILGCSSNSPIGVDKSEECIGDIDYWVVKILPDICAIPTGLFTDNITPTQAKAHWNSVPSAEKYQLFYREIGGTNWTKLIAESNFKNIYGLSPETNYEYKVRTKCDGENTMFSPVEYFTTLPLKSGEINDQFIIYPNPSSETIIIKVSNSLSPYSSLQITDISGKIISELNISSSENEIDISNYPSGIYFVKMIIDDKQLIEKFIKQ